MSNEEMAVYGATYFIATFMPFSFCSDFVTLNTSTFKLGRLS